MLAGRVLIGKGSSVPLANNVGVLAWFLVALAFHFFFTSGFHGRVSGLNFENYHGSALACSRWKVGDVTRHSQLGINLVTFDF